MTRNIAPERERQTSSLEFTRTLNYFPGLFSMKPNDMVAPAVVTLCSLMHCVFLHHGFTWCSLQNLLFTTERCQHSQPDYSLNISFVFLLVDYCLGLVVLNNLNKSPFLMSFYTHRPCSVRADDWNITPPPSISLVGLFLKIGWSQGALLSLNVV